jgi:hypothetical protein
MSEAHARAWWADVEHLRDAAERRSAERAKARIQGRAPVALTPLQPLHVVDRLAAFDEALDAVEPVAPGEAPRRRRFARDGAPAAARAGTLTLIAEHDEHAPQTDHTATAARRFARRPESPSHAEAPRPRSRPRAAGAPGRPATVPANAAHPGRRTIEIRGQAVAPAVALVPDQANGVGPARRRPSRRPSERFAASPDRIAFYAVLLGVFLILVALASGH